MTENISRRSFLGGALAAGAGAAAMGLSGCAPQTTTSADSETKDSSGSGSTALSNTGDDWLGVAPEISDDDCVETVDTEVLIVGWGVAGTCASLAAIDEGAKVLAIDKHFTTRYGGNFHAYINSETYAKYGMDYYVDPQKAVWDIGRDTQHSADLSLAALWAYHGAEVIDYLYGLVEADGMIVQANMPKEGYDTDSQYTAVEFNAQMGSSEDNNGEWVKGLQGKALEKGVEIRWSTPAQKLIQNDEGRVVGVYAKNPDGDYIRINASRGVIVCGGDYGSNEAMIRRFQSTAAQKIYDTYGNSTGPAGSYTAYMEADEQPSEPLNDGLPIKMCCWAGAYMESETHGFNTWTVGGVNPNPYLAVTPGGGNRFMNEALNMLVSGPVTCAQPGDEPFYWQILDQNSVENPLDSYYPFPTPVAAEIDTSSMESGNTIEELAEKIGVNPENLRRTIDRYNELCESGVDEDFAKEARFMVPLKTPPYYATQQHHVWTVTFGGVVVNRWLEVLDQTGVPIPGLYAAGNTIGRRFGWHYEASFFGLSNAFAETHGYFAGKNCVKNG